MKKANSYNGYLVKYSDGLIKENGVVTATSGGEHTRTITLSSKYSDTKYNITLGFCTNGYVMYHWGAVQNGTVKINSFGIVMGYTNSDNWTTCKCYWETKGY